MGQMSCQCACNKEEPEEEAEFKHFNPIKLEKNKFCSSFIDGSNIQKNTQLINDGNLFKDIPEINEPNLMINETYIYNDSNIRLTKNNLFSATIEEIQKTEKFQYNDENNNNNEIDDHDNFKNKINCLNKPKSKSSKPKSYCNLNENNDINMFKFNHEYNIFTDENQLKNKKIIENKKIKEILLDNTDINSNINMNLNGNKKEINKNNVIKAKLKTYKTSLKLNIPNDNNLESIDLEKLTSISADEFYNNKNDENDVNGVNKSNKYIKIDKNRGLNLDEGKNRVITISQKKEGLDVNNPNIKLDVNIESANHILGENKIENNTYSDLNKNNDKEIKKNVNYEELEKIIYINHNNHNDIFHEGNYKCQDIFKCQQNKENSSNSINIEVLKINQEVLKSLMHENDIQTNHLYNNKEEKKVYSENEYDIIKQMNKDLEILFGLTLPTLDLYIDNDTKLISRTALFRNKYNSKTINVQKTKTRSELNLNYSRCGILTSKTKHNFNKLNEMFLKPDMLSSIYDTINLKEKHYWNSSKCDITIDLEKDFIKLLKIKKLLNLYNIEQELMISSRSVDFINKRIGFMYSLPRKNKSSDNLLDNKLLCKHIINDLHHKKAKNEITIDQFQILNDEKIINKLSNNEEKQCDHSKIISENINKQNNSSNNLSNENYKEENQKLNEDENHNNMLKINNLQTVSEINDIYEDVIINTEENDNNYNSKSSKIESSLVNFSFKKDSFLNVADIIDHMKIKLSNKEIENIQSRKEISSSIKENNVTNSNANNKDYNNLTKSLFKDFLVSINYRTSNIFNEKSRNKNDNLDYSMNQSSKISNNNVIFDKVNNNNIVHRNKEMSNMDSHKENSKDNDKEKEKYKIFRLLDNKLEIHWKDDFIKFINWLYPNNSSNVLNQIYSFLKNFKKGKIFITN